MVFRGGEHPRVHLAAQFRGAMPRPIRGQQSLGQKRIAQVQAAILVNEQGAQEKSARGVDGLNP